MTDDPTNDVDEGEGDTMGFTRRDVSGGRVPRGVVMAVMAVVLLLTGPTFAEEDASPEAAPAAAPVAGPESIQEIEPNDSLNTPTDVTVDCDVAASVRERGERDYFRVRVEKPLHLSVEVTGVPGANMRLRIVGSDRSTLVAVDGRPVDQGECVVRRVRRDSYLIEVASDVKKPLSEPAPYTLRLRRVKPSSYEPPIEDIKAAIGRGLDYLVAHQEEDGSFDVLSGDHGVAGLALMGFVSERRKDDARTIERIAELFRTVYQSPGSLSEKGHKRLKRGGLLAPWSNHVMYEHAIGVLAMAEYLHHGFGRDGDRAMVGEGVNLLARAQATARRPEALAGPFDEKSEAFGGWRYHASSRSSDLSASGWCLIALAAAETAGLAVPVPVRKDYMVFCRRCFDEEVGAYRYGATSAPPTNTTNAVGVLTTLMCVGGECPVVRRGLKTILGNLPIWLAEGQNGRYPFYYWYYASRAMYVAGGDYWKTWRGVMCPLLLKHQNEDGSWDAALAEEKVGVPYTTAVGVLILQLMSGNPPAYLRGLDLTRESYPCPRCVDDIEDLIRAAARDRRSKEEVLRQIQEIIDRYRGE